MSIIDDVKKRDKVEEIQKWCVEGMLVCFWFFFSWVILGYIFGYFRTDGWNNLDFLHQNGLAGNWVISELIIFSIILVFMRMMYHYEKKRFNEKYAVEA